MKTYFIIVIFLFTLSRVHGNNPTDSFYIKCAIYWIKGSCALDLIMFPGKLEVTQEKIVFRPDKKQSGLKPIIFAIDSNLYLHNKVYTVFLLSTPDSVNFMFSSYGKWEIKKILYEDAKNAKKFKRPSYKLKADSQYIFLLEYTIGPFFGISSFLSQGYFEISESHFTYTNLQHPYWVKNINFKLEEIKRIRKGIFFGNVIIELHND